MQTPSATELRQLLDKQAIAEVLYRYCHACDRGDAVALAACFHAEATHDHGGYVGPTSGWIPAALEWLTGRVAVTHMVTNPLIVIEGEQAISDCHFIAYNRLPKAGAMTEEVLVKGRYIDRLVQEAGRWTIMHRTGIHDLELIRKVPIEARSAAAGKASGGLGDDPYLLILATFAAGTLAS